MKREIGLLGLTFISVGGIMGSGWLLGPLLAVLSGTVQNYAYLVRKYCVEELGIPRNVSLEDLRQTTPIRDAALLCR